MRILKSIIEKSQTAVAVFAETDGTWTEYESWDEVPEDRKPKPEQPNPVQDQIIALEARAGSRMQREAWLASFVPQTESDKKHYEQVAEINAQIAEMRSKL